MLSKAKSAFGGITKIKNLFSNFSGYASPFSIFIIMVILVISGFYGWEKYQEYKFPEKAARGEIVGPVYYVKAIKFEIDRILNNKNMKDKRAMELAEQTKNISDKANLYSLKAPQSWVLVLSEGAKGNKLSNLIMQSSYFSAHVTDGKKYYDAGAKFSSFVLAGENKNIIEGNGGHAGLIKTGKYGGQAGEFTFHIFKDPDSENGEAIDGHIIRNGKTYSFSMAYNPQTFSDAEFSFQEILDSVKFLK